MRRSGRSCEPNSSRGLSSWKTRFYTIKNRRGKIATNEYTSFQVVLFQRRNLFHPTITRGYCQVDGFNPVASDLDDRNLFHLCQLFTETHISELLRYWKLHLI